MKIKRLLVDFTISDDTEYPGPDYVQFHIEVLVERDYGAEKRVKFGYSNMFRVDHFKPMWEQLMERATREIGAAVKAAEEKDGTVDSKKDGVLRTQGVQYSETRDAQGGRGSQEVNEE